MKQSWSKKWTNIFMWASGYLSIVAFAVVGGYAVIKGDDEQKKTAKSVLITTLIFAALSAILTLVSNIGGMFDGYYSSLVYEIYRIASVMVTVLKIAVYALCIIFELFRKDDNKDAE